MKTIIRLCGLLGVLACVACSRQVSLAYVPTGATIPPGGDAVIGQVSAVDQRGESDPTWIGAIRGGFGNPLKVLHTSDPLNKEVTRAFRAALARRGLMAPAGNGPLDLAVSIVDFKGTQIVRREADIDFVIALTERGTGRQIYRDEVKAERVNGSILALDEGVFGSTAKLQALSQATMNQVIDQLLDKPAFLAALRTARMSGV